MVGQKSSRKTLPPKIYKPLPTWNLTEIHPKKSPYLKPEIHVPKHHVWHAFVKCSTESANLGTCPASSFRNGHVGHVGNVVVAGHRVSILTQESSWDTKKGTPPMNASQGVFFLCVWDGRRKKSIMEKPQKMLIGMMRLSFGFFWLVFQDVNLHIRWLPLCTLGISHGALGWFIPQNCAGEVWNFEGSIISQRIHGTGIFTHIYHKIQPNVGRKYTSHIDPMGLDSHKHSAKVGILQQKLHGFLKVFLQTVCEAVDAKRACRDIKIMFVWFSVFSFPRSLFWGCGDEVTDVRYHSQKLNSSPPKNDG